ncbi:uncharacterized protein LOC129596627 [Paramacrobiotus metropolitanus]|uniref:uncharacterized protein LOC129596627 n=1 Tax=Paramacrobiotus metropolitanus TaxID=2943436 RepID=UPI002445BFA1|nr:uncharacterized protein LOC129596627 [Paramacrobiotus metropolitanus]
MLIYGDDGHRVHAWNAVDVLLDGQLQHGDVINVAPGGLIIDFQCAARRAEFVAYGRIFHCDDKSFKAATQDSQVLLRRHPDGAWIWYPGMFLWLPLTFEYEEAHYVEVQRPSGAVQELVPLRQVRAPPSDAALEERCVKDGDFVIRCYALPAEYGVEWTPLLDVIFKYGLQQLHRVRSTSLVNQTLVYLQRRDQTPLSAEQVEKLYTVSKKLENDEIASQAQRTISPAPVSASQDKSPTSDNNGCGLSLPPELLVEIFQALDSIERVRCQRVCALWHTLLTTVSHFPGVRVSGKETDYGPALYFSHDRLYWIVACFLKCLSPATRRVVVTQLESLQCSQVATLIKHVVKTHPISLLMFVNCSLGDAKFLIKDIVDGVARILARCSGCGSVVVRNCSLHDHNLQAAVAYHVFRERALASMKLQLWDLFEKNLILTKPVDRPALAAWIADCIAQQRMDELRFQIVKGLILYQSVDPRPSTAYRTRNWTTSTLAEVDVNQLTTLTAAALSEGVDPIPDFRLREIKLEDIRDNKHDPDFYLRPTPYTARRGNAL